MGSGELSEGNQWFLFLQLLRRQKNITRLYILKRMTNTEIIEMKEELEEVENRLRWLLKRGSNDESLVDEKRNLEKKLRKVC